jgi:exosortase/archaeosortase family protein
MQQLATWLASIWLDWVGILHFATGVDIRTPGQNFIVEDACSGIHSMFAAITIGVIYGVFNRYSLFRLVAIVMQMVFWVVLANGGRVFAIVYAHDKWSYDLSSGLVHDFVGLVTFAVGVLLAFSGDHLWRYLFPVSRETIAELPFEERAEAGLIDRPVTVVAIAVVAVLLVVGMGTSLVFYSNFSRITAKRLTVAELALQSAINFEQTAEGILPEELAGWKRSGFKVMEQSPDSVFGGLRSFVWQFSNGSRQVILSIDGPYPGWHDLKVCYSATGWNVESELTEIEIGDNRVQLAKLVLERPPFERGFVLFGCVDKDKRCIAPPSFYGDSWGDWFGLRTRFGEDDVVAGGGGVVQLQLLDQTPIDLSNREIEENTQLFTAAYQHLFGAQPEAGE